MDLKVLVVDQNTDGATALLSALEPEIKFVESDFSNSMLKAVEAHTDVNFSVCLISDAFPAEELSSFFNDISKLGKQQTCVFVQVKPEVPETLARESLKDLGFATIVSRRGTHADKEALRTALNACFHAKEVEKRKVDIDDVMSLLLKEVDTAANAIRRGRGHKKLTAIPMDLVDLHAAFDEACLTGYFESLHKKSNNAEPVTVRKLEVPERIMRKKLPGLLSDTYDGASHRVWNKLSKKLGKKEQ